MMIDYDGFREYRLAKNYVESGISSCISMIGQNRIQILNNFDEYINLNDEEKLLKFENDTKITQKEFDKYHNYSENTQAFGDLKSVSKMYKEFIEHRSDKINSINSSIRQKNTTGTNTKNIILYGAPGVGKTHNTNKLISLIESANKSDIEIFKNIKNNTEETIILNDDIKSRVKFITFHQSYSYEDFIEGFRPNENGNIELKDGIFKKLCDDASKSDKNFYIVIDEINRGNISKIFGELITLIEEDKRNKYEVTLPYSKEPFKVPSNLYIIATMNSTDKSIATIDIALRRRFTFLKMKPNLELVTVENAKILMNNLNEYIKDNLNEDYMLGHSYFMDENIDLEFIKEYKIRPLLEEYFYADDDKLNEILDLLKSVDD